MVSVTVFVAMSTTETEPNVSEESVTYARVPSGATATATGANIAIIPTTVSVATSITDTEPEALLATQRLLEHDPARSGGKRRTSA